MKKCLYISRNYKHPKCGGAKARRDIESIMAGLGYRNIGFRQSWHHNGIAHGVLNTMGVFKAISSLGKGDIVVLQYQMKMFRLFCDAAHRRGAKVICQIHDLDSFREKSLKPEQEIPLLNRADVLITHNHGMRGWLMAHGCTTPMVDNKIFDYLDGHTGEAHRPESPADYSLFFVGNPSRNLNDFLYQLAALMPEREIYVYGGIPGRDDDPSVPNLRMMGFVNDTDIMTAHKGDFGISWYGDSLDDGVGKVGEYMAYNNPHKVGLYLRCNSPVIAWSGAGMTEFLQSEGVAVVVDSLRGLDGVLNGISTEEYARMCGNVTKVSNRLQEGHYLKAALRKAIEIIEDK